MPIVAGIVGSPLIAKPGPETVARVTIRLEVPLFVSVTLCVLVCPNGTLLKFSDTGKIVRLACVPVPLSEIVSVEFEASLVTVRLAVVSTADVGAN